MFPIKYVGMVVFVWVILSFLGAIYEDVSMPLTEDSVSDLSILMSFGIIESEQSWGPAQIVAAPAQLFGALYRILTFQFSFIYGTWVWVKWIILGPLVATVIFGLVILTIQLFTRAF